MFCQVIIDIVHENVASPFTYRIPDGMTLEPGQRVAVPFGRQQKEGGELFAVSPSSFHSLPILRYHFAANEPQSGFIW